MDVLLVAASTGTMLNKASGLQTPYQLTPRYRMIINRTVGFNECESRIPLFRCPHEERLSQPEAMLNAVSIARAGGAVGRVGVPQENAIPNAQPTLYSNITIAGGPAPARAYIEQLLPDVLEGRIEPGRVFDRVTNIDGVPDGYKAMNDRKSIKVMIEF